MGALSFCVDWYYVENLIVMKTSKWKHFQRVLLLFIVNVLDIHQNKNVKTILLSIVKTILLSEVL